MLRFENTRKKYDRLRSCLSEIHPEIELNLTVCDDALAELGFASSPLCIAEIALTEDEFDELMDELI